MYYSVQKDRTVQTGHTECYIQYTLLIGFVDSGSEVTTMKNSIAQSLELNIEPKNVPIVGYGEILSCYTKGTTIKKLKLGSCIVKVRIYIVPDEAQTEDMIIGKNVLEKENVLAVTHCGHWFFESTKLDSISDIPTKIPLCIKKTERIPPFSVKPCSISTDNQNPVYVEGKHFDNGIYISTCMTKSNGVIPIFNLSPVNVR